MAKISHLMVDGLAFVMIGIGLTAAYVGMERKLPIPALQQERPASALSDPVVTGSIANKPRDALAKPVNTQTKPAVQAVSQWSSTTRVWVDPPSH